MSAARTSLGIVTYALGIHLRHAWAGRHAGLSPALAFFEECRRLGAGGMQFDLRAADEPHVPELRRRLAAAGMFFEGIVSPPRTAEDLPRFERDLRLAREAGATLARTVIMPGRRYEEFGSLEAFRRAEAAGARSLELAEPVLARHGFRLAVENHKDHRVAERLRLFERLGSEWVGACVDVGNNLALLEDPVETVRALAPWALTVHLKDQALRASEEGFLLADAALGEGYLDLPGIVRILHEAKPGIRFNLEVITRDALGVPVLTPGYWTTLPEVPARDLAATLAAVKAHGALTAFEPFAVRPVAEQLEMELQAVRVSLAYAGRQLGLEASHSAA